MHSFNSLRFRQFSRAFRIRPAASQIPLSSEALRPGRSIGCKVPLVKNTAHAATTTAKRAKLAYSTAARDLRWIEQPKFQGRKERPKPHGRRPIPGSRSRSRGARSQQQSPPKERWDRGGSRCRERDFSLVGVRSNSKAFFGVLVRGSISRNVFLGTLSYSSGIEYFMGRC